MARNDFSKRFLRTHALLHVLNLKMIKDKKYAYANEKTLLCRCVILVMVDQNQTAEAWSHTVRIRRKTRWELHVVSWSWSHPDIRVRVDRRRLHPPVVLLRCLRFQVRLYFTFFYCQWNDELDLGFGFGTGVVLSPGKLEWQCESVTEAVTLEFFTRVILSIRIDFLFPMIALTRVSHDGGHVSFPHIFNNVLIHI